MRWPGRVSAGMVNDHQLAFYDVMPTFCELMEDKAFPKKYINKKIKNDCFDGISFASTLLGDDGKQQNMIFFIGSSMKQIRLVSAWETGNYW